MSIFDHLDSLKKLYETKSYIYVECPCCSGKLGISKSSHSYGAYKCWTNFCESKDIREALGIVESANYYLSPYKVNVPKSVYSSNIDKKIHDAKPIGANVVTELATCPDYVPISSIERNFAGGSKKKTTIYDYSETQRIYRLDNVVPPGKKEIYLQWWDRPNQTWEAGVGSATWPIYLRGLTCENLKSGNSLIWVEGEKSAEALKAQGYCTITNASHCFNYAYLYKLYFAFFLTNKNIEKIIIIPDDDAPGYHKAEQIQKVCWYLKKGAEILTLAEIATDFSFEPNVGFDIADLVNSSTEYDFSRSLCN
jgi:hypothetical protein